jgi:DNA-binding HxlR family transcriptional regulator
LTANTVNGSGNGARSGAQTLTLLAAPLNVLILQALEEGPKRQADLRQETGFPAQTTLRAQLRLLESIDALEKNRRDRFPGALQYELTTAGRSLFSVADTVERWLGRAPDGPLTLGDNGAKAAIKALTEGWSTTMLRALAARPLSLTELNRVISSLSYPSLERRLAALRLAGQVKTLSSNERGTPYAVTAWVREGVGPLVAAARWELRHIPRDAAPLRRIDAEAAFLLSLPLLNLPENLSGSCRMAMELPGADGRRLAGVMVGIGKGRIESCTSQLQGTPDAWALGSVPAWLDAMVKADTDCIEPGGDGRLAHTLLDGLHRALFKPGQRIGS